MGGSWSWTDTYPYTRWKCSPESALKWIVQGFQQFHTANDVSCSHFEWGAKISAFLHLFADLSLTRERILEIKLLQVPNDSNPFTTCDEMETLVCKGCPSRGSWTSELNSTREHTSVQSVLCSAQLFRFSRLSLQSKCCWNDTAAKMLTKSVTFIIQTASSLQWPCLLDRRL